jgi:hypothetical protein
LISSALLLLLHLHVLRVSNMSTGGIYPVIFFVSHLLRLRTPNTCHVPCSSLLELLCCHVPNLPALVEQVDPQSIVLAGDSAGGGLCLAALVAIRDTAGAPLPAGAVLLSPWVNLAQGSDTTDSGGAGTNTVAGVTAGVAADGIAGTGTSTAGSFKENHLIDYLPHDLVALFARSYSGNGVTSLSDPG